MRLRLSLLALILLFASSVQAEVRTHALISDGMVLQQGKPIRLWGTAAAAEQVQVEFRGQTATTVADKDGRWQVELGFYPAGGPYPLTITGSNVIRFAEVFVGEVWVCSGQSNMGWPVATRPGSAELKETANSRIRLFTVPQKLADQPESELTGTWAACGPETLVGFSAVAYYFGRELAETQNVPIGLIHASYGGSPVDQWIESKAVAAVNPPASTTPRQGGRVAAPQTSRLYNGMIAPLLPFGIRGVIWYQGEADVGRASRYGTLFTALIENWRTEWKQGPFPFLFVQIAPYGKIVEGPTTPNSAELREAQREVSRGVENTAMAVVTDWGHETDIHVKQKKPVGHRLALLARSLVYEEKLVSSGPTFKALVVRGNEAVLSFENVGAGLVAKKMVLEDFSTDPRTGNGGALHVAKSEAGTSSETTEAVPLVGFTIAGRDGKFVPATAVLQVDTVVVSSPEVAEPVAVRYGWADYPTGNLFNADGLPASPFQAASR